MRKAPGILLLSLFTAGCAASGQPDVHQRIVAAEQSRQALELRISRIEERLIQMENEAGNSRREGETLTTQVPVTIALDELRRSGRPVPRPVVVEPAPARPARSSPMEAAPPQETGIVDLLALERVSPPGPPSMPESTPSPDPPSMPESAPPPDSPPGSPSGPELTPLPDLAFAPQPAPARERPPAPQPPRNVSRTQPAEKSSYDAALALYFKGEFGRAGEAFQAFLRSFPGSALAPNSLYWEGESLYALGLYDQAILLFQSVVTRFPGHHKAAAALLKAGYAYERMKDMDNAHFYWQILLDDFPQSAPAALARKRMGAG